MSIESNVHEDVLQTSYKCLIETILRCPEDDLCRLVDNPRLTE